MVLGIATLLYSLISKQCYIKIWNCVTIRMKATEKFFLLMVFITLCKEEDCDLPN